MILFKNKARTIWDSEDPVQSLIPIRSRSPVTTCWITVFQNNPNRSLSLRLQIQADVRHSESSPGVPGHDSTLQTCLRQTRPPLLLAAINRPEVLLWLSFIDSNIQTSVFTLVNIKLQRPLYFSTFELFFFYFQGENSERGFGAERNSAVIRSGAVLTLD